MLLLELGHAVGDIEGMQLQRGRVDEKARPNELVMQSVTRSRIGGKARIGSTVTGSFRFN